MIRLHPLPEARFDCPRCHAALEVRGWFMPGMRTLADLRCGKCGRDFYGDLPAGHGLHHPLLLDRETGEVTGDFAASWFGQWLRESWAHRSSAPLPLTVEEFKPIARPLLLNCLDGLYGHCLLKLLNAQYYLDHRPEEALCGTAALGCDEAGKPVRTAGGGCATPATPKFDLIVLVPKFLRWMVPQGVAAVWTVDVPLRDGWQWNDGLAEEIRRRISPAKEAWLSVALSHPHPADFGIERFTGVRPFPIGEWFARMKTPTVTFIWREDRLWDVEHPADAQARLVNSIRWRLNRQTPPILRQRRNVVELLEGLRDRLPALDAAVAGFGEPGGLPDWIADLRTYKITSETEKTWCERYAASHFVAGVHGSNMLLPSAHAGGAMDLMPPDRWGNTFEDILPATCDPIHALYRYHFIPAGTSPAALANALAQLMRSYPPIEAQTGRCWCSNHEAVAADPYQMVQALRARPSASLRASERRS